MKDRLMREHEEKMPSTSDMRSNMRNVTKNWNLGPKRASEMPKANPLFWKGIAVKWDKTEKEARRRSCGNCEYGKHRPEHLKAMEKYPISGFDKDGGGRIWCDKFDFVCHNLRVCQAWEEGY